MSREIEITPRDRDRGQAVRIRTATYARLKQLSKDSGRDIVEILDIAVAQMTVAGQKRAAK